MVLAVAGLLVALIAAPQTNVKGKWDGQISGQRQDGTTSEDTALMILDQKDRTITGTVGGNDQDQHPITSGKIEGNKVTLVARNKNSDREYQIELTVQNDEMKGTIQMGPRTGQLSLKRRKE